MSGKEIFIICALALPSPHFTHAPMVAEQRNKDEIDKLHDFIHKIAPGAEITITPPDQEMPEWERLPFTWRGLWIWIQRRPVSDLPKKELPYENADRCIVNRYTRRSL